MSTLSKAFRRQLEGTVLKARDEAERGAAAALESFGVAEAKLPVHLDDAGKNLRRKLRAHGRQVGDVRRADDSQEVEHLIHECAYEHWHRMLFARFLAENGFLIEPESGMDVDLEFCEERARETKSDKWEIAAGFAQRMLPGIFRPDDPVLQVRLPAESRNRLTALLASLPREVFLADDSLGWVYQFWQTKKKQEVNDAEIPIGANELAAVTQLFTEDYMVEFLLHNTLGAWWTAKRRAEGKHQPIAFAYLRLNEDGTPAAGAFDGWPKTVKAMRVLDPCMGSGHFLVFALVILVQMWMEEEGMSAGHACVAVLRDNLFGLELDPRCTQIAAFNLALAAWKLGGHQKELPVNLACSGLGLHAKEEDWLAIVEKSEGEGQKSEKLKAGMKRLYQLFQKAPVLGSLINPGALGGDMLVADFHDLQPLLAKALQRETEDEAHELAITAQGVAKAAEILASQFTLVVTNVPYLVSGKQCDPLKDFLVAHYYSGRSDLASAFILRSFQFCFKGGTVALVTPQNWLFLGSYRTLREELLSTAKWETIVRLGARAFETITGEVVNVGLVSLSATIPGKSSSFFGLDVSKQDSIAKKELALRSHPTAQFAQLAQLGNPDARILFEETGNLKLLSHYVVCHQGLATGDLPRFGALFWEIRQFDRTWIPWQGTVESTCDHGGRSGALLWEGGHGQLHAFNEAHKAVRKNTHLRGVHVVGKSAVVITQMGRLPATLYSGERYDDNMTVLMPNNPAHLPALWAYCSSTEYGEIVRQRDHSLKVPANTLAKIPFDLSHWQKVAAEKYPNGLPQPFSSDPTQWLFNGHPKCSDHPLQVAVARLVGYQWPRQTGFSFPDCPALAPDGLEKHADNDGLVCFSQARDEAPAATRLRALLADAYGKEWSHALECKLIATTGSKSESLEEWLVNDFFDQHCGLFQKRPFVWHIWDGRKDGFNLLVNYHKLAGPNGEGHRTLETLTYAYLGDWIARQKDAVAHGEAGADDRLAAALELQGELKKIVAGEPPYDLFIRWKALAFQPIGWEADINDGVRLNIRPFMMATLSRGNKGCGLFRAKPGSSVKWDKDRGKEPQHPKEDFPWFWKWDELTVDFAGNGEFDGNRWNDCHYTTKFKREAREKIARKA